MEVKTTYDKDGNMKKTFIIPVGYMSKEKVEEKIKELMKLYNDNSWIREFERKELLKNRKEKLNILWTK